MHHNQFNLLKDKRFFPICLAQLLQAFNDNAYKLAMLTLISFHLASSDFDYGDLTLYVCSFQNIHLSSLVN